MGQHDPAWLTATRKGDLKRQVVSVRAALDAMLREARPRALKSPGVDFLREKRLCDAPADPGAFCLFPLGLAFSLRFANGLLPFQAGRGKVKGKVTCQVCLFFQQASWGFQLANLAQILRVMEVSESHPQLQGRLKWPNFRWTRCSPSNNFGALRGGTVGWPDDW